MPPSTSEVIARPDLLARLGNSFKRRLTLVCAPAGYGKTTLISTWLKGQNVPTAWLSLDEADNDIERFWRYSIAALQGILPNSADALANLASPLSSRETLVDLINALTTLPQDSVLVWDDYHELLDRDIHASVMFFLEHLPPQLHVIMTSRYEPPLNLSRMRVRRQILELSANDLRFSQLETAAFLNELMGLRLSEEEVALLGSRTEGWVASLQLAALSLQNSSDPPAAMAAFTGTAQHMFDYLVSEVLSQQDASTQSFLLQTSILERFNAELCSAVTGLPKAAQHLAHVQKAQLFLVPLDATKTWFRYHPLFAETLQQRLKHLHSERIPALHAAAADWLERSGFTDEAVRHVIAGGDMERAVALVEKHDRSFIWLRDELSTLHHWLQALPEAIIRARPRLCLDKAWLQIGQRASERWLEDAERLLAQESNAALQGELAILRAEVAINEGDAETALSYLDRALGLLPDHDVLLRGMAKQARGYILRVRGDVQQAELTLREAVALNQASGNKVSELFALTDLAEVLKLQGHLSEAKEVFGQAVARARDKRQRATASACAAFIGLADVEREQNRLDQAKDYVQKGLDLAEQARFPTAKGYAYTVLARLARAEGDLVKANEYLQAAETLTSNQDIRRRGHLAIEQLRLYLQEGDLARATKWSPTSSSPELQEREQMTLARVLLAQGQTDACLKVVSDCLETTNEVRQLASLIELKLLEALALEDKGQGKQALSVFAQALRLAEAEGFIRLFIDEGQPVRSLLQRALAAGVAPSYVSKLLKSFTPEIEQETVSKLLTKRELEILQLISEGLSNEAIAQKLIRSIGTVKVHSSNLYSKLGVKSRTEAVARARELELL